MGAMLLVVYMAILIYLITFLVICIRKKSTQYWIVEYLSEVLAIVSAIIIMRYYNNLPLPQDDFYPWLEYLWEIVFSMGAAVLYFIVFIISIVCGTTVYVKEKTKG